jgi:hypothetical protein
VTTNKEEAEMSTTQKTALTEYVNSLGLTYQATFQPTPQPADKVKNPQLHWLITLSKGKQSMSVPYSQGIAHVKGYRHHYGAMSMHDAEEQELFRKTCETGKLYKLFPSGTVGAPMFGPHTQPAPELLDVLYCIVSDADVLNYSSYEEWGPELGYDPDSRAGEKVYQQCIAQSLALKQLIGFAAIEKLRELYQDY